MVSNGPGRINQAFSVRSSTWPKSQLRADWANMMRGSNPSPRNCGSRAMVPVSTGPSAAISRMTSCARIAAS
ncbi:MAG: hypothetical protein DI540_19350 [Sphingobium sp.]|nr:MAG: hypothetical protein DI540_19350 [Sphingobium sp.]